MNCSIFTRWISFTVQYNTIQLYKLEVEGVQHMAKANNVGTFQRKMRIKSDYVFL